MKGHMEDGKFHPHTPYKKGVRKSRDQSAKTQGVKVRKKKEPFRVQKSEGATEAQLIQMQRAVETGLRKKIDVGDNPEHDPNLNKFLSGGKQSEGLRGRLIARSKDKKRGIILAENSSFNGKVKWGKLYEIVEKNPRHYPEVKREVEKVPDTKDWELLV